MTESSNADPLHDFGDLALPVHVIGIGGAGSDVARTISKGGFRGPLHFWDGDVVEPKNHRNQTYTRRHDGWPKTRALAEQCARWGIAQTVQHPEFVEGYVPLSGVVFLCVDSMAARRNIYETCLKHQKDVALAIELRMDGVIVIVHAFDPCDEEHQRRWESYWYSDGEAVNQTLGCAGPTLVLQCASMCSDLATLQLMRFVAQRAGKGEGPWNQVRLNLQTMELKAYRW